MSKEKVNLRCMTCNVKIKTNREYMVNDWVLNSSGWRCPECAIRAFGRSVIPDLLMTCSCGEILTRVKTEGWVDIYECPQDEHVNIRVERRPHGS